MADTKISALTAATSLADADLITAVQGGVNKKAAASVVYNYIKTQTDTLYAPTTVLSGLQTTQGISISDSTPQTTARPTGSIEHTVYVDAGVGSGDYTTTFSLNETNSPVTGNVMNFVVTLPASSHPTLTFHSGASATVLCTVDNPRGLAGIKPVRFIYDSGAKWQVTDEPDGATGVTAGTYGSPTQAVVLAVGDDGKITTISQTAIDGGGGATVGTGGSEVPSNDLLVGTPRAYTDAQGQALATLTDGSTIAWDLDAAQSAYVAIAGNRTVGNCTNKRAGFTYDLFVKNSGGSHTLSFGTDYIWPGGTAPTLSTSANAQDWFRFFCDGTKMYGAAMAQNYVGAGGGGGGAILITDGFTGSSGLDTSTPDTLNTPGGSWTVYQGAVLRNSGRAYANNTSLAAISTGVSDGYVQALVIPSGGSYDHGIVARMSDSSNFIAFTVFTASNNWYLYKFVSGSSTTLASGSVTPNTSSGNTLKIVTSGSSISCYIDGTQVGSTVTETFNQTATLAGIYVNNALDHNWDDFVVSS